jgi:hypothetical protein
MVILVNLTTTICYKNIRSGQTKTIKLEFATLYFSAKHTALRRKSKDCLARNQDNVFELSDMSIRRVLFQ